MPLSTLLKTGASPLITKVALGVLVIFITAIGFLSWKLYSSQVEITSLTESNSQLQANIQTLKANNIAQEMIIDQQKNQLADQKKKYEELLKAYERLESKSKQDEKRAEEFRKKLADLLRDLESEEAKLLNQVVPDSIIDLYNLRNKRLRDVEEGPSNN